MTPAAKDPRAFTWNLAPKEVISRTGKQTLDYTAGSASPAMTSGYSQVTFCKPVAEWELRKSKD